MNLSVGNFPPKTLTSLAASSLKYKQTSRESLYNSDSRMTFATSSESESIESTPLNDAIGCAAWWEDLTLAKYLSNCPRCTGPGAFGVKEGDGVIFWLGYRRVRTELCHQTDGRFRKYCTLILTNCTICDVMTTGVEWFHCAQSWAASRVSG